mmetsp:Transcript_23502/g.32963  ORF Transcript_23502/g.32963 Transcript_23502/m.32963 type:complete len:103 (-) Transcript_23502:411-719(-)
MSQEGGKALVFLYRRLLRSAATYPSRNRWGIYQAIREEFKENRNLDPTTEDTKKKIAVAYKGLDQLRQFDEIVMQGGDPNNPNWSVTLEQNPMPKPPGVGGK